VLGLGQESHGFAGCDLSIRSEHSITYLFRQSQEGHDEAVFNHSIRQSSVNLPRDHQTSSQNVTNPSQGDREATTSAQCYTPGGIQAEMPSDFHGNLADGCSL